MLLVTSRIRHGNISHVPQLLEAPCLSCISVTVAAFVPQVHNPNQSIPTKKTAKTVTCDWCPESTKASCQLDPWLTFVIKSHMSYLETLGTRETVRTALWCTPTSPSFSFLL